VRTMIRNNLWIGKLGHDGRNSFRSPMDEHIQRSWRLTTQHPMVNSGHSSVPLVHGVGVPPHRPIWWCWIFPKRIWWRYSEASFCLLRPLGQLTKLFQPCMGTTRLWVIRSNGHLFTYIGSLWSRASEVRKLTAAMDLPCWPSRFSPECKLE